ncbi:uncharacterized protein F5891DRAFT_1130327 [Suillus fuscotomentosus]|uniref:ABC-2 type transporter transmembrane domain-containing protein n=1 Tax=Suillus fuscotomentosus TaxID=1912939 RepID=A0AAD4E0T9_9AGAM|nr:uncharacterized protein F5891DRAFT_1130327 [Suillus fuscotomentosus]KAG1896389.1 hypothetical protein F5891DRAFT_1130327 [Suillus fuscotomentosus]
MLDVIATGATASTSAATLREEIENIHNESRARPVVQAARPTEFATLWYHQLNPTYLVAKFALSIAGGLLIGFTFYMTSDSLHGIQNKLFAIFLASVLCVPSRNSFRQCSSTFGLMYNWTTLIVSQFLVELPWNIMCSSLFFFCWYWTVRFPNDHAGYTTSYMAVASMAPTVVIASLLFSALFSNGVLQPYRALGWWQWMHRVPPFTYFMEGLLGQAIGGNEINCARYEFVLVIPPSGSTCSQYLHPFMQYAGSYLADPSATSTCLFCPYRTTDSYASHHWRDLGIMLGITVFNVCAIFTLTYICRIRKGNPLAGLQQKLANLRK